MHICGPAADYPYAAERIYTPPDSLLPDYLEMLETFGVERCVLVQPSIYGNDNRVLLKAMTESPLPCRGVAVIDVNTSDGEIGRFHRAGVRGARFNLVDVRDPSGRIDLASLHALTERIKPFGWHAEFLIHVDEYPELDRLFADFPVDIVFGHMGYLKPPLSIEDQGFQALLRLLAGKRCWVKLTGPMRISADDMPYPDVNQIAHALVEAAPDRLLWGSDWPHVKLSKPMPNDGDLLDLLPVWVPDPVLRQQILVDNPDILYDFNG